MSGSKERMGHYNGVIRESVRGVAEEVVRSSRDKLGWFDMPVERRLYIVNIQANNGILYGPRLKIVSKVAALRLTYIAEEVLVKEFGLNKSVLLRTEIRDLRNDKEIISLEKMLDVMGHPEVRRVMRYHPSNIPGVEFKYTEEHDMKNYQTIYGVTLSVVDTRRHIPDWIITGARALVSTLGNLGRLTYHESSPPPAP